MKKMTDSKGNLIGSTTEKDLADHRAKSVNAPKTFERAPYYSNVPITDDLTSRR